jgi:hypothetical protein
VGRLKHQEKRSMDHFAGLDVSVKETSLWAANNSRAKCDTLAVCRLVEVVECGRFESLRMPMLLPRRFANSEAI